MRRRGAYPIVITLDLLLAGTAILGGIFIVPTLPPAWLDGSPFVNYFLPALGLTLVGVVALIGAIELAFERTLGIVASFAAGLGIIVFEIVQVLFVTLGDWLGPIGIAFGHRVMPEGAGMHPALFLEPVYIAIGLGIAIWSYSLYRSEAANALSDIDEQIDGRKAA